MQHTVLELVSRNQLKRATLEEHVRQYEIGLGLEDVKEVLLLL